LARATENKKAIHRLFMDRLSGHLTSSLDFGHFDLALRTLFGDDHLLQVLEVTGLQHVEVDA
jgi:hypothetical protein